MLKLLVLTSIGLIASVSLYRWMFRYDEIDHQGVLDRLRRMDSEEIIL